jgi:hypothetical protein
VVALGALVLLALHTHGHVIHGEWLLVLIALLPVLVAMEFAYYKTGRRMERPPVRRSIPIIILAGFAVLHLFSSGVDHNWFYFMHWTPVNVDGIDWTSGMMYFLAITALLLPLLFFRILKTRVLLLITLLFCQIAAAGIFLYVTKGLPLYRYDHPSFMFRLHEFSRTYPQLINYVPHWNGGAISYITSVSGTTSLGVFLWPLWRFLPIHTFYTLALAFLFLVVVPLMVVLSLRLMGARWAAGLCAGILSLGVSLHFFLWLLNYGTVGSSFALCFIVPFSACLYRVIWLGKTEKWLGVLLVLSAFFLIQWPPGVIMAAPFILSVLLSYRRWTKRKIGFLVVCGLIVFVLYARTVWLFMSFGSGHMDEVLATGEEAGSRFSVSRDVLVSGLEHLRAHLREGHPLVVFMGLAGALVIPYRSLRRWYIPPIVVLALAAGWGPEFFPKLQISRMAVPLLFTGVVPAGIACDRLFKCCRRRFAWLQAMVMAVIMLGAVNVVRLYANENPRTHYVTISPRVERIVEWIRTHTPRDGRVLFAGPAIHAYGGGQVAYMALLADREMFACDYYSFPPDTTEYRMPPKRFQHTPEDTFEYMKMFNVTHVITYRSKWVRRFRRRADLYREREHFRDMVMFEVLRDSTGMFYKGAGTVEADFNRLSVTLDEAQADVVLCYKWIDGFTVSPPVEIYPYEGIHGERLLGIRPNGEMRMTLRFRRWF